MALYSGNDLIAVTGISKAQVRRIVNAYGIRKIGELKFTTGFYDVPGVVKQDNVWHLDSSKASDGHMLSDDFDGWVYPNGDKYSCADFPAASAVYAASPDATTFNVPNLANVFFKGHAPNILAVNPDDNSDVYNLLDNVSAYNKRPKTHYHSISDKAGIQQQLTILSGFVFCAAGNAGTYNKRRKCVTGDGKVYYVPYMHSGNRTFNSSYLPLPLDMTLKLGDLSAFFPPDAVTDSAKSSGGEVFPDNPPAVPAHSTLPAMIYIGMTIEAEEATKTFPVRFISSVDNLQIDLQWVRLGGSAVYPVSKPTYSYWVWSSWDSTPVTNILKPTTVVGNYVRKTYVLNLTAAIQTVLDKYRPVVQVAAAGSLAVKITRKDGTVETKTLAVSGTFGNSSTAHYTIQSEAKVEITATAAHGLFKRWSGSYTSKSSVLIVSSMTSNHSIIGEFGNEFLLAGWRWRWEVEYNCDDEEKRAHYLDNVATYTYAAGELVDNATGEAAGEVQEEVTNNSSTNTLPAVYREYVELEKVFEDPNFKDEADPSLTTRIQDYGLFLLDTRSQAQLPIKYKANVAEGEQFYGFVFPANDSEGHAFVSPVTIGSSLELHGWEFPEDVTVTSIDSYNKIIFNRNYAPAIRPIPEANGATVVKLDTRSTQKIRKATAEEYAAFWGSENPIFL